MSLYLHHLSMDLPQSNVEGGPDAGLGLETKPQISSSRTPIHNIPSPWTERARCGPDLSRHLHCSYKQIEGFTHGIEPCCAAFSHFLLDWRKRGSREVPLCQHLSNGGKKAEKIFEDQDFYQISVHQIHLATKDLCE